MDNGLSSNRIYSIVQDSLGFIWFGTNYGLNRFDGTRVKNYYYSANNPHCISSNNIRNLHIDSNNKMWISLDNGIDIYDPDTDSFSHFDAKTAQGESIDFRTMFITSDRDGEIWVTTANDGAFRYNPVTGRLISYKHDPADPQSLSSNKTMDILCDSYGLIWISTQTDGISIFSKEDNHFINYKKGDSYISDNGITTFCEDFYGNVWIGTYNRGLDKYDRKNRSFSNFPAGSEESQLNKIWSITEYKHGELLITSDNGVGIFCLEEERLINDSKHNNLYASSNKFVYCAYKDKDDGLWMGSYFDGVECFSPHQNIFTNVRTSAINPILGIETGKVVNVIYESERGNLWIGTDDNGIWYYDIKHQKLSPYKTAADIGDTYYCVHDIVEDKDILYVATYQRGLEVHNKHTRTVRTYLPSPEPGSIPSSRVFALYKSSVGRLYIGTSEGVCYLDRTDDKFISLDIDSQPYAITEDKSGTIWVATTTEGLWAYNPKSNTYRNYPADPENPAALIRNRLTAIAIDRENNIWAGSDGYGLCRYNTDTDNFTRFNALQLPNYSISKIIPDGEYLWLVTGNGLVKWQPNTGNTDVFTTNSGIYNTQFTINSGCAISDGKIVLGSSDGFTIIPQHDINLKHDGTSIILTDLVIHNQKQTPFTKNSPLKQSIENTHNLHLSHKQNNIELSFAALDYISGRDKQFRYQLKGLDNQWHYTDWTNQKIYYTNLPSGNYHLLIEYLDNKNNWTTGHFNLGLTVVPHFLLSKIAIIIYIILSLVAGILLLRRMVRSMETKHSVKLKELQIQNEKALYDSKIEFFTNIAHEIRTPLSLIVGPLEYLMKSQIVTDKYGEYLAIIEQNYKRLFELINQLLDFRKVDTGIFNIMYSTYKVNDIINDLLSRFDLMFREKGITVNVSVNPGDIEIITDREAFTKIISNLLTNAVKFTKDQIDIEIHNSDSKTYITVSDNGKGIPEKERDNIFQLFYQLDNQKILNSKGIGIGLYMTQSLVSLMGGSISAEDREDGLSGASIKIELPSPEINKQKDNSVKFDNYFTGNLTDNEDDLIGTNKNADDEKEAHEYSKRYSILVVDDNPEILNFLGKILSSEHFVISASNGREALSILENNIVDMIVSDIVMDKMDGLELCRLVKTNINTSHIPLVLLTAKTDTDTKIQGLEYGADAYIEKPFSPAHLTVQIDNLFRKREETRKRFASTPMSEISTTVTNKLDQEFVNKCTEIIEYNISDPDFSVDMLAREIGMSRTSTYQKIKAIIGMTPNDFIKLVRLNKACEMMRQGEYRITEIGFLVGFSSSSYFAKCFTKQFGILPTEYIKSLKKK